MTLTAALTCGLRTTIRGKEGDRCFLYNHQHNLTVLARQTSSRKNRLIRELINLVFKQASNAYAVPSVNVHVVARWVPSYIASEHPVHSHVVADDAVAQARMKKLLSCKIDDGPSQVMPNS